MKPQRSAPNLKFIEPMYARLVNELPQSKDWLYEVKLTDAALLLAGIQRGDTLVQARKPFYKTIPTYCPSL